jgi:basic membrane protein A
MRISAMSKYGLLMVVLLAVIGVGSCKPDRSGFTSPPALQVALLTPGPVSDGGWNAAAYEGLQLIKARLGAETALVQTASPADFEDSMRDFAARGFNLVFAHGFEYMDAALTVAKDFPNTDFVVSSGDSSSRNVASVTYNFDQATFVEGIIAAGVSKSGVAGAIGGVELPTIRATFEGFKRGFLAVRPGGRILISYTGNFNDVGAAKEATLAQIGQGADVFIHNADAAGLGVFQAAAQAHAFAFGAFNNQNTVAPDVVLASAVTSIPRAFLKIAGEVKDRRFHPGMLVFGMKDGMVKIVLNPGLKSHIPAAIMQRALKAEQDFR